MAHCMERVLRHARTQKRNKLDPSNYCLISLLSVVSKKLERIIAEQLTLYLEEDHLISAGQFGFRKGHSASDMFLLAKSWYNALDSDRPSLVIVLDIAGTFDRVWYRKLLAKLEQLGVTGRLLELFSSYL